MNSLLQLLRHTPGRAIGSVTCSYHGWSPRLHQALPWKKITHHHCCVSKVPKKEYNKIITPRISNLEKDFFASTNIHTPTHIKHRCGESAERELLAGCGVVVTRMYILRSLDARPKLGAPKKGKWRKLRKNMLGKEPTSTCS